MKSSLKFAPILGIVVMLTSCGSVNPPPQTTAPVAPVTKETPTITPEMRELSSNMISASKDLSVTQVIGNTAFKSYDKLVVKYGSDAKNLTQTKEFLGKDGFVVLDGLKPASEYSYEIFAGANKISIGTVKTQKK